MTKYQKFHGVNPLDLFEEFSIYEKFKNYFKIIKKEIIKNPEIKEKEDLYLEKIIDFIFDKIYEKIFPTEPDVKDQELFKKAIQLSWVEFKLFIKKDYILDSILPYILNEFVRINIVKSPYQKYNCIKKIFNYIEKDYILDSIFPCILNEFVLII